ncbi:AAA family ATPase [Modestobacter sp. SSW1-42]|uniref:AAA family ATPase n=1 Tax=Modestobacter sp. SSW1-42 TaxID=596372 RepID=UPI0039863941
MTLIEDPWTAPPAPSTDEPDAAAPERLYVDVAALLAGGLPKPPAPRLMRREDGHCLFYDGKVNVLFGDPECGKTMIAMAACSEALNEGRRVTILDVDHNGAAEIVSRLILLGAHPHHLADPTRFRLHEPDDAEELRAVVASMQRWRPAVAIVDSLGEVIPMLGLSSNSPDDYSTAHRDVLTAMAQAGAAVIAIDHMPKSEDARTHGQTGTVAKRRAVNGANLRVTLTDTFVPGQGGAASLTVHKDRTGGLRAHCPNVGKNPPAGRFILTAHDDGTASWRVTSPDAATDVPTGGRASVDDIAELDSLDPEPTSVRDVKTRLGWGSDRATKALAAWKEQRSA